MNAAGHMDEVSNGDVALPFPVPVFAGFHPAIHAALLSRWRFACGLGRGLLRVLGLGVVIPAAFAHAAVLRWTCNPTASALARNRSAWLHRWSGLACRVLGLVVERRGFVPASGMVVVDELSLIDTLVLAAVTPLVFVVETCAWRRPFLAWVARLAGALFADPRRRDDVGQVNSLIERALRRRQLVIVSRHRDYLPSALLQPVVSCSASLTACAVLDELTDSRNTATAILTQPRSRIEVSFQPPTYHRGNRKKLAQQIWREVQMLQSAGKVEG